MKIGILGTGVVGQTLAARLDELGHSVTMGTRDVAALMARPATPRAPAFSDWHKQHPQVQVSSFAEAAAQSELIFNCTSGVGSLPALEAAGAHNLADKTLVDVANPFQPRTAQSVNDPPALSVCNTDSLAEQIQRAFPEAKVVKSLNTVNTALMGTPQSVGGGDHHIFVCGNHDDAKAQVTELLASFGWKHILDLGDLTAARGLEMVMLLWMRLRDVQGTSLFNFKIVR
jgi:predicted dinucleotide-binding enzyme